MDEITNDLELGKQLMTTNYPHLNMEGIEVIQDGGIKTIWKVETSIGTVCLKRIRKSIPIVKFTTAAQVFLAAKGALVANIIPTKDHELFFIHEGYALVLYSWIEGTDLEIEDIEEHAVAGIKGLAQFHKDSVGFIPPVDCDIYDRMGVWPEHYKKMLEEMKQWKVDAALQMNAFNQAYINMADEMIEMAAQSIQLLQGSCYDEWVKEIGEYGYMCHQDYGKGNALQTDKGVYVLDLDNVTYDIPIRDIRKLITKRLEEVESWQLTDLESLIHHYESILPLTEEQRKLIYIDMLYPHNFYGCVKNPFKKGKTGEVKKILKNYQMEKYKLAALYQVLKIK